MSPMFATLYKTFNIQMILQIHVHLGLCNLFAKIFTGDLLFSCRYSQLYCPLFSSFIQRRYTPADGSPPAALYKHEMSVCYIVIQIVRFWLHARTAFCYTAKSDFLTTMHDFERQKLKASIVNCR